MNSNNFFSRGICICEWRHGNKQKKYHSRLMILMQLQNSKRTIEKKIAVQSVTLNEKKDRENKIEKWLTTWNLIKLKENNRKTRTQYNSRYAVL